MSTIALLSIRSLASGTVSNHRPRAFANIISLRPRTRTGNTSSSAVKGSLLQRLGLHGDLGPRFQAWAVRHCPFFLEPIFLGGYALLFFLIAAGPRRAVMHNLSVLIPSSTRLDNALRALRVFWSFASSITDAVRSRQSGDEDEAAVAAVDWEVVGVNHFEKIAASADGAVVLTAHMGNYDVAAPVFSEKFRCRLNAVRAPERTREQQEYRKRELEGQQSDNYAVRYNSPESVLGLELTQALGRGEIVAIQGDRILFEVSAIDTAFDDDHQMAVPKGPFVLALTTRTQIHPLFILRLGRRRYRVLVRPPIECLAEERGAAAREAAIARAAADWMNELAPLMRKHWHQWYVFEPVLRKTPAES